MAQKKEKIERMTAVLAVLRKVYAHAKCSLDYKNPFELLCATILSAQCTDERVNKVTPSLFAAFPTAQAMAQADVAQVEHLVQSTGFYKNKALSLVECAKSLVRDHGGVVPKDLDALTALRGVGRKTANVVLGNVYGIPGLVVDTHVGRLSRRLGFTKETDAVKVEHDLMPLVPKEDWVMYSHWLIYHGRSRCMARNPQCVSCEVRAFCPQKGIKKVVA